MVCRHGSAGWPLRLMLLNRLIEAGKWKLPLHRLKAISLQLSVP